MRALIHTYNYADSSACAHRLFGRRKEDELLIITTITVTTTLILPYYRILCTLSCSKLRVKNGRALALVRHLRKH